MTNYKNIKRHLKDVADMAKSQFGNDKPMVRLIINDSVDFLSKEYQLSAYYTDLLAEYACKLHQQVRSWQIITSSKGT